MFNLSIIHNHHYINDQKLITLDFVINHIINTFNHQLFKIMDYSIILYITLRIFMNLDFLPNVLSHVY